MTTALEQLKERMAQVADVRAASALAHWDQQTMMPSGGAPARANSLATLQRITHEMFIADETGRLLQAAEAGIDGADPWSDDACLVRLVRRQWDKARRVPTQLAAELARAASIGQEAWVAAREASDFKAFAPYLERNFDLARRYIECHAGHDGYECGYDILLDDYEPEMLTRTVTELFTELRGELIPVISRLTSEAGHIDDRLLYGDFPIERQRPLVAEAVAMMGFEPQNWRIDDTVHPFAIRIARGDVRITTRWDEDYFPGGLYGAMHECGHGLYEAGLAPAFERSPLGAGESLGMHESQSRLWENMVGRGRAFCGVLAPRVAHHLGGQLSALDADTLYRAVNRVKPSYIRVESDEATYALHIVLRFELEQQLVDGQLTVAELPEAWNARFEEFFGIRVTDDAQGVLQDVHWSAGLIGYFPTYALGNLIAGQLWERVHSDIRDLDRRIAAGELATLREWLREHVHRHGSKFTTAELLQRVVGGPLEVRPFVRYLKAKLGDVYGLDFGAESAPAPGTAQPRPAGGPL
ncbi:MAG: carboxypeptidase M32 [Actinomycetota bacterium]|nr:carboxypeptidase M32 [Actinomycetota bacterium]